MSIEIIAGIEGGRRPVIAKARELCAPVMLSANSLWRPAAGAFSPSWHSTDGLRRHLDSGGFVAMHRYGGFRFSVEQYATLAAEMRPEWWAQMDLCCEPEIASNRAEVARRIDATAANLRECRQAAEHAGAAAPLIVLQGWQPDDYTRGPAFDDPAFLWPAVVGVGSVCRRQLHGANGLLAVLRALDARVPAHVRFHLFGVKSQAVAALSWHPRIASIDSQAWNVEAWRSARRLGVPRTGEIRAAALGEWIAKQRAAANPHDSLF